MKILFYIFAILFIILFPFIFFYLVRFIQRRLKGDRLPKFCVKPRRKSFLKRVYYDFPRQLCDDKFSKPDYAFNEYGLHLVVGEQGSGKTITVCYLLQQLKEQYPKLKIRTNLSYKYEDGPLRSWADLVFKNNGVYGEVDFIDEIQNWFNSLESKDFPVEMFQEISQQRKQRKMIIGTSQVWGRVSKPLREQCAFVYKPMTILGCLTIVRKYKPSVSSDDGSLDSLKLRSVFFFVHNSSVRDSFDTYHKIKVMSLKGFKPASERSYLSGSPSVVPVACDGTRKDPEKKSSKR